MPERKWDNLKVAETINAHSEATWLTTVMQEILPLQGTNTRALTYKCLLLTHPLTKSLSLSCRRAVFTVEMLKNKKPIFHHFGIARFFSMLFGLSLASEILSRSIPVEDLPSPPHVRSYHSAGNPCASLTLISFGQSRVSSSSWSFSAVVCESFVLPSHALFVSAAH